MLRTLGPVVVLWMLGATGLSQTHTALIERIESAGDPHTLDDFVSQLPATPATVAALRERADALFRSNDLEKSRRLNQAAVTLAVKVKDGKQAARSYRALGLCYRRMGRQEEALQADEEGLRHSVAAGDALITAELYRGVGLAHRALGHMSAATEAYLRSIEFCDAARDRDCALKTITNLGSAYSLMGDFRKAAEVLHRGLAEANQLGSPIELAMLNNLAVAYASQGDPETARAYFERELALGRAQKSAEDMAFALTNLVPIYRSINAELARHTVEEGLRLAEETKQPKLTATLLINLAGIERVEGRYSQALEHLTASLKRFQELGQRAYASSAMTEIAAVHADLKDDAVALEWAVQAQSAARAAGFDNVVERALGVTGRVLRHMGRRDEARTAFEEELSINETTRGLLAGGDTAARSFLDGRTNPRYTLMEMAVEDGRFEAALETLEGAKARMLLDVLENGRADLSKFLTESERFEEQSLIAAVESSMPAALRGDPAARARWDNAKRDLSVFRTALYSAHPELKLRRGQFAPFRLADADVLIPDSRTALVEFALSGDRIFAFVLTRKPGGKPTLTVTSNEWKSTEATAEVQAFRKSLAERSLIYRDQGTALYRRVFGPIAAQLRGKTTVGIVPDGVLWSTPLQALVQPGGRAFLEDHAVFFAPSLTALREIRERRSGPEARDATLLAFGAPTAGKFAGALPPLPESAREVTEIGALYGKSENPVYVGAAARKSTWMKEAPRSGILHLATHGVLNTNNPLYSYMVLSDGVIEAREILDLDLRARLVVLSACETGLGSVSSGEGLIGMSWAFLVAGSPAAVVSQWKVDSRSTSELMVSFHRFYHGAGLTAARALQRAALETMKTPAYRHPSYWAGFVVMGAGY